MDNPLWDGMGRIFDVCVLNILWLLCCLPVVTVGPATTALYYAMIHLVRAEDSPVSKDFFHSFRQNFKQGIRLGIPLTAIGVFLAMDVSLCYHAGGGIYTFFMVFFAVMFLLWAFITLYAFPLLAKFEKKNTDILIWAFTLSIRHLGRTLLMLFALVAAVWICRFLPGLIFIIFGLVCEFHAVMLLAVLKPYLPEDAQAEEEWKPLSFLDADKKEDEG